MDLRLPGSPRKWCMTARMRSRLAWASLALPCHRRQRRRSTSFTVTALAAARSGSSDAKPLAVCVKALVGFRGVGFGSYDQGGDEGAEQGFAPAAGVVHELEEAEVERQLVLRDAPVRAQPRAQQRPEALDGVDVDLAKAVPILIAGIRSVMLMPSSAWFWREFKMIGFAGCQLVEGCDGCFGVRK